MCQEVLFRLKEGGLYYRKKQDRTPILTPQYADFTRSLIGQLTAAYQQSTVATANIQPLFALESMDEICLFWTLVQKCVDHRTPGDNLCFACSKLYWEQNSLSLFVTQIWTRYGSHYNMLTALISILKSIPCTKSRHLRCFQSGDANKLSQLWESLL